MKVVVAEKISAQGMKLLGSVAGWQIVGPEEFASDREGHMRDADGLIVRSALDVGEELLRHATRLKVIGRAGVGVDNIHMESATRRGIVVMNTPGANAVAVAELTVGFMLALARHIPRADQSTRAGKWEKKSLQGAELRGKKLGVVGLGRIGVEVARRAMSFEMQVLGSDPYVSPALARELSIRLCALEELYAEADYITLHVGLTPQTERMINREAIGKMKKGVRLVNCARGELVDEAALAEALQSGQVAAAAIDVFVEEPPAGSPLLKAPNLVATPHIGGSTGEAQEAVGVQIAAQIREYLLHNVAQNAVNVPSLTDIEFRQIRPYLEMAQKMSSLLAQLLDGNLEEIHVTYQGSVREWKTELLRSSAVAGVLQHGSQDVVNLVNAAATANARGVRVVEDPAERGNGVNGMRVTLRTKGGELTALGTVVHGSSPRLVELNGIDIESPLEGHLVIISNQDLPGVIGAIGNILGNHEINIARFSLGREAADLAPAAARLGATESARNALAIVQTDSDVPGAVLRELQNIKAIRSARVIHL